MKDNKDKRTRQKIARLKQQFLQGGTGGTFDRVLSDQEIAKVAGKLVEPHRERLYPPLDTLRLFVGQVLSADRACQDVVGRRLSERIAQGQSVSALNTGSYCDARQRLPTARPSAPPSSRKKWCRNELFGSAGAYVCCFMRVALAMY